MVEGPLVAPRGAYPGAGSHGPTLTPPRPGGNPGGASLKLFLVLALLVSAMLALSIPPESEAGGVFYCPDGVYLLSESPLELKAFRKGEILKLALPYRRPDWRLVVRYEFARGKMRREELSKPRPVPRVNPALVRVCLNPGKRWLCWEAPRERWRLENDPATRTLWLEMVYRGPLKAARVKLSFGDGECGGYLYYENDELPW